MHLRRPTSHDRGALHDLAAHAYHDANLDLLLLTGDISTTGEPEDIRAAHRYVTAPAATAWLATDDMPTLSSARIPIALLPGNHDRYLYASFPFGVAGTVFDDIFNDYWCAGQNASILGVLHKSDEWLLFVGADFSLRADVADPVEQAGTGRVYRHVLKTLRLLTKRARDRIKKRGAPIAAVWVLHFAPECTNEFLRLVDDKALLTAAHEEDVRHILCGHTHQAAAVTLDDVTIHCAGTASAYGLANVIHTREFTVSKGEVGSVTSTEHRVGIGPI